MTAKAVPCQHYGWMHPGHFPSGFLHGHGSIPAEKEISWDILDARFKALGRSPDLRILES